MAKILLIESSPADAQSAREALEARGDATELTGDAGQAVELARSTKPDLIVLCVELDTGSGYSICNKLRRDVELGQVPLILTSREATTETFEQHRRLKTHADRYLHKPYAQADLLATIDGLLRRGGSGETSDPIASEQAPRSDPTAASTSTSSAPDSQSQKEQNDVGTVELDLSEEAVRSLVLAVDLEVGALVDPAKTEPTQAEDDSSFGPELGSAPEPKKAPALVFDDQAWEVPDMAPDEASDVRDENSSDADIAPVSSPDLEEALIVPESSQNELAAPPEDAEVSVAEPSGANALPSPLDEDPHAASSARLTEELKNIRDGLRGLLDRLDLLLAADQPKN